MRTVVIAFGLFAGAMLSGCGWMEPGPSSAEVFGYLRARCDAGELKYCARFAYHSVKYGFRSTAEGLAEFQVSCRRAVDRHKLDPMECERLVPLVRSFNTTTPYPPELLTVP
jgi:hypothetical protein